MGWDMIKFFFSSGTCLEDGNIALCRPRVVETRTTLERNARNVFEAMKNEDQNEEKKMA